ncbi:hypothetical protein I5U23_09215 [Stenotrophomonas maltophilia]|uniref:Uncharacterized protein n=1 Tax=Stenotrophomonas riyadhensis TaxID=2859893 RepID=A0ABT2XGZ8_9GAMM|nr:hypothetical protein [Stenotrophomonas sp. CFS3442]MBH1618092.1 hypothetical protein [Stenotrophomonas maltophilia]MCV0325213.1 hypothetical protein [Stenotrophomonas sp. CFS3442]HEL4245101.1 hypothetical protein [Stenotrophomonas maltophilia]
MKLGKAMAGVSLAVVDAVARAVFERSPSLVTEFYSAPGEDFQRFSSAEELYSYAKLLREAKGGAVFVAVQYPDMCGEVSVRKFELVKGPDRGKHLFTIGGWGLINVHLPLSPDASMSARICVLSERAALGRERSGVGLPAVDGWNWRAVESHSRRLKRVLNSAIARSVVTSQ